MASFTENSGNNSGHTDIIPHQFKPSRLGKPDGRPQKQLVNAYLIDQLDEPLPDTIKEKASTELYRGLWT